MKRKFSIIGLIIGVVFISTFFILKQHPNNSITSANPTTSAIPLASAKIVFIPENLDTLISESPYIIEAKQTGDQTEIIYNGITFVTTQLTIKQVIKGASISTNDVITLLQTKIVEDPLVKKDGHVLLFLEKYSGPIIKDAYVCKGLYQGHYDISKDGTLLSSFNMANENANLFADLNKNNNFKELTNKIKSK